MKPSSRRTRTPAELSESTNRHLNMYALAATAAGLGVLAQAYTAEAKIVYTPDHQKISLFSKLKMDLNHDGISDFQFSYGARGHFLWLNVYGANQSNEVWGTGHYVSALPAGVRVGSKKGKFQPGDNWMEVVEVTSFTNFRGQWKDVHQRYLGLKFLIKGKIHYGWARLNVDMTNGTSSITLTGYAYETIPNKAIITGKTKGTDQMDSRVEQPNPVSLAAPTLNPATLGLLAMGSPGLSIWRREESGY
jgi:hypothetical protein